MRLCARVLFVFCLAPLVVAAPARAGLVDLSGVIQVDGGGGYGVYPA